MERWVFRWWCVYMALFIAVYVLPELAFLPGLQWIGVGGNAAARFSHRLIPWIGHRLLKLSSPMTVFWSDSTYDYVLTLSLIVVAAFGASVWSPLSKGLPSPTSRAVLRAAVRYGLAIVIAMYGISKLTTMQFLAPTPERLLEPYGDSSAQGLLWTFMGYSAPYTIFTGAMETLAAVLLFWPRTALLGGLLAIVCLTNVVALNFAYDVPVKLFSTHLLAMAVFVVAPEVPWLVRALAPPSATKPSFITRTCTAIFVVFLLTGGTMAFLRLKARAGDGVPAPPLFGIYNVERLSRNGQDVPSLYTDRTRWRRVVINRFGGFVVYEATDDIVRYRVTVVPSAHALKLTRGSTTASMAYTDLADDEFRLDGTFDGATLQVTLRRIEPASFELLNDRFHWISDAPHNK